MVVQHDSYLSILSAHGFVLKNVVAEELKHGAHVGIEDLNDTNSLTFSRSCTTRMSARGWPLPHISAERCVPGRFRGFLSRG